MDTIKTVLISAATFVALAFFQAHPVICGITLYVALNLITTYICFEAGEKGSFIQLFSDEDFLLLLAVTIAGTAMCIFYLLSGLINRDFETFNNIWKYLFKTEPPVIKFQSPIIIQKAVDPESDVG